MVYTSQQQYEIRRMGVESQGATMADTAVEGTAMGSVEEAAHCYTTKTACGRAGSSGQRHSRKTTQGRWQCHSDGGMTHRAVAAVTRVEEEREEVRLWVDAPRATHHHGSTVAALSHN